MVHIVLLSTPDIRQQWCAVIKVNDVSPVQGFIAGYMLRIFPTQTVGVRT